jgi:hypothetical protein
MNARVKRFVGWIAVCGRCGGTFESDTDRISERGKQGVKDIEMVAVMTPNVFPVPEVSQSPEGLSSKTQFIITKSEPVMT